jgi:ADP-ribose pyrophosphatase YjhB (NUDIX family)
MKASAHFRHCPRCGCPAKIKAVDNPFHCSGCGFHYYFNPSVAVAAFISDEQDRVLFIRRAREPAQGKLALPGGFVDFGESAETALRREIDEEVGLKLGHTEFLCSHPNHYFYREVTYSVLDLFFCADCPDTTLARPLDAVATLGWLDPMSVAPDELAFVSMQHALRCFQLQQRPARSDGAGLRASDTSPGL